MRANVAVVSGKLAKQASKMIGKGGGNIPGIVARKIDVGILKTLSQQVENIIVITGTNGKTTTSNLLAGIFQEAGEEIVHNAEGNNLITGIITAFIDKTSVGGKLRKPYKYAVLEVDEGNVPMVVSQVSPKYIIVNNFFRDQLNRYGEIDTIVQKIKDAAEKSKATLILNADDPFVMRIGLLKNEKVFFGLKKNAYEFDQYSMNESKFCPTCGNELVYTFVHYGQLGFYKCQCGFERPKVDYEVSKINDNMSFSVEKTPYQLGISGTYNVYNAIGAVACAREFGIEEEIIYEALKNYQASNGRMQRFEIGQMTCMLNLAKNQVGADISISEMLRDSSEKQIVYVLNDLDHDSEDISWIWDTDYERLAHTPIKKVVCSGTRAYDMALRLKYAGIQSEKITIIPEVTDAIDEILKGEGNAYILPTYTGLNPVQRHLVKRETKN